MVEETLLVNVVTEVGDIEQWCPYITHFSSALPLSGIFTSMSFFTPTTTAKHLFDGFTFINTGTCDGQYAAEEEGRTDQSPRITRLLSTSHSVDIAFDSRASSSGIVMYSDEYAYGK